MTRLARDRGRLSATCTAGWHGTYSAHRYGCRCPHAREDRRLYQKRRREGRAVPAHVDSTGTRRRLQALAVLGWRWADIADRLGTSYQSVQKLVVLDRAVHVTTAARVAEVYRELCVRTGPSPVTAQRAAAKGWHGPLAWGDIDDPAAVPDDTGPDAPAVDEWAVTEALAGRLPSSRLTDVDLAEAMRRLLTEGLSPGQARYRLRLTNAHAQRVIRSIRTATTTEEIAA